MIGADDRAIIKLYSGTLLQLFHVTWHIIIGQKGGVCTTYAMNPRNLKLKAVIMKEAGIYYPARFIIRVPNISQLEAWSHIKAWSEKINLEIEALATIR